MVEPQPKTTKKKCHYSYVKGCKNSKCTFLHIDAPLGYCIEPKCEVCYNDSGICLKTKPHGPCKKWHSSVILVEKIRKALKRPKEEISSLKLQLGTSPEEKSNLAAKIKILLDLCNKLFFDLAKNKVLPSVSRREITSETQQLLDGYLMQFQLNLETIIPSWTSQSESSQHQKPTIQGPNTIPDTRQNNISRVAVEETKSSSNHPKPSKKNEAKTSKGPHPGKRAPDTQQGNISKEESKSVSNQSTSSKNLSRGSQPRQQPPNNSSNMMIDFSSENVQMDFDDFLDADDSGDEPDFPANSSTVKPTCHFYLVAGKCGRTFCRLRHEGQRYYGVCTETKCHTCKGLGLLRYRLSNEKNKKKIPLPLPVYKETFEKLTSALEHQYNSHILPIKLIVKNTKGNNMETLVKIFNELIQARVGLMKTLNKIFQGNKSNKEKISDVEMLLKSFANRNENILKYLDENAAEENDNSDDADSQGKSDVSSQSQKSSFSKGSEMSSASYKNSKTYQTFAKACHNFQMNNCKNPKCPMEHKEPVYGVCAIPHCSVCKNSLKTCKPAKHNEQCRRIHLKPELQAEAIRALNHQWKIVNKIKMDLLEVDPKDNETINTLIELLTLKLKQRAIFCSQIKNVSGLLDYLQKKGDNLNYQKVLKDRFRLEIAHLKAGLPAYSSKKEIIQEFGSLKNQFCLVLGQTGSGKTTQTPQFILQQLKSSTEKIICVQPRKVAAISLAKRVAEELGYKLGEEVGYYVGEKDANAGGPPKMKEEKKDQSMEKLEKIERMYGPKTRILFVTESILLKKVLAVKRYHIEQPNEPTTEELKTPEELLKEDEKKDVDEKKSIGKKPKKLEVTFFKNVKSIILDEIHERSLTSDLIYGMMKDFFVKIYPEVKIFLLSATVNKKLFTEYFNCNAIEIPGRPFPVEKIYKPAFEGEYIEGSVAVVKEILNEFAAFNPNYMGHILIFLTEVDEMNQVKGLLEEEFEKYRQKMPKNLPKIKENTIQMVEEVKTGYVQEEEEKSPQKHSRQFNPDRFEILLLHGRLTNEEQQLVFSERTNKDGSMKYKIILSTRLAESSVTINGIKVVIDCGFVKDSYYDPKKGLSILKTTMISQSSADQRAGRAGRTSPGICYRLYSRDTFNSLAYGLTPEISRVCLDQALLKIIDFGIDPNKFLFLERPDDKLIQGSLETLRALGAIETLKADGLPKLTNEGKLMTAMSTEPKKSKCIIEAEKNGVLNSVIAVLAVENNSNFLFRYTKQGDKKIFNTEKKGLFEGQYQSDLICYMNIFEQWMSIKDSKSGDNADKSKKFPNTFEKAKKKWADEHNLDNRSLNSSKRVFNEIRNDYYSAKKRIQGTLSQDAAKVDDKKKEELVLKSFLEGYFPSVSVKLLKSRGFMNVKENFSFNLHLSSHYARTPLNASGDMILFCTQMENTKNGNLAKHISVVPREWVEKSNSPIREEMIKKLKSDFTYEEIKLELPTWAVDLFMRENRQEIEKWIEGPGQNKVAYSYPEDQKGLCILTIPTLRPEVEKYFANLRDAFAEKTKRYRQVYEIPGSSCSAVLSDGYKVEELLFAGEYITVAYKGLSRLNPSGEAINYTPDDIAAKLGLKKDEYSFIIVNNERDNTASGNIRFLTKAAASKFYHDKQLDHNKKFEIIPLKETPSSKNTLYSRIVKLSVPLSLSESQAIITFESIPEANEALERINGTFIEERRIKAVLDRNNKNCIFITGLSPTTDELDIKRTFKNFKILRVSVKRQRTLVTPTGEVIPENSEYEQLMAIELFRQTTRSIVTARLNQEQVKNLVIGEAASINKNRVLTLETVLPSRDLAEQLYKDYDGNIDCFRGRKLRVKLDNTVTITVKPGVYYVLYRALLSKVILLKENLGIEIRMSPLEKGVKFFKIKIECEDRVKRREAEKEIETFIKGKSVQIQSKEKWKYFTKEMKDFYADLQEKYKGRLYMEWFEQSKILNIYTSEINLEREIEARIHEKVESRKSVEEQFSIMNYSIKKVIDTLEKNKEYSDYEIDFTKKIIAFRGENLDRNKINALLQQCKVLNKTKTQSSCEICFEDVDSKSSCFLYCKHRLCKDCSNGYIRAEILGDVKKECCMCPICQDVPMPIALKDCKEIAEIELIDKIFQNHLEKFIVDHPKEYRYCHTNDCSNILALDSEMQGICSICQETYCFQLLSPHKVHIGKTCSEYLEDMEDPNQIQKLLDSGKFRLSPCCNQLIMKEAGCDHITCQCHRHWCYACLYLAPGDWSYAHFDTCKKVAPIQRYKPKAKREDDGVEVLIRNGTLRVLQCCDYIYEKAGGCFHLICPNCNRHSCNKCLAYYDTEEELDLHQADCPHKLPDSYQKKYGITEN